MRRRLKAFLWLVAAALAVQLLLYTFAHEVVATTARQRTDSAVASAARIGVPASLGTARITPAVRRWMQRLTKICQTRNADVWELTIRQQSTRPLAPRPAAERSLEASRAFERAAGALIAPAGYASEARWIARVNEAKTRLLRAVRDAVVAGDVDAMRRAERAYARLSKRTNPGFLRLGLYWCGQYQPRAR